MGDYGGSVVSLTGKVWEQKLTLKILRCTHEEEWSKGVSGDTEIYA